MAVAAAGPLDAAGTTGIYVTLNEVNPALLPCRANRVRMRLSKKDATTADGDIIRRRWFPLDIDPVRPSGISSTDAEHRSALDHAGRIAAFLAERGWLAPIIGDFWEAARLYSPLSGTAGGGFLRDRVRSREGIGYREAGEGGV